MQTVTCSDVTLKHALSLSFKEKIEIAKLLDKLGISAIELPVFSGEKRDALLIKSIAAGVKGSVLTVSCPLEESGIESTWTALQDAKHPRLQLVVPTSTVQMEYLCHKKPPVVLEMIGTLVKKARSLCADVEFVAQDASRSEPEFLEAAIQKAIDAGATTVTVSDDAGIMTAEEFAAFIGELQKGVPALREVRFGMQCDDSYAMANACAVAAIGAGVDEIKTTVAGNSAANLSTVSQYIRTRGMDLGIRTDMQYTVLQRAIKQICWILHTERSKTSAFENIGSGETAAFELNEHDSITQVIEAVKALGYDLSDDDNTNVYREFKRISVKKTVTAKELEAIVASSAMQVPPAYVLQSYVINSGNVIKATAHITLQKDGETISGLCTGDGPIDAAFLAVESIVGHHYELDDFQIQAVTEGKEAMGSALVKLRAGGKLYAGNGISTDIIGASIRAYLNALNKIVYEEG